MRRCLRITTPGGVLHPALIKYELLSMFCFFSGCIGHRYRNCEKNTNKIPISYMLFGSWLGGVDVLSSMLLEWVINSEASVADGEEIAFQTTSDDHN